jgi:hypothetical protein
MFNDICPEFEFGSLLLVKSSLTSSRWQYEECVVQGEPDISEECICLHVHGQSVSQARNQQE